MTTVLSPTQVGGNRVVAIDGLQGIAAQLVVLFHLHAAISRTAVGWLWGPVDWIARNGFLGVEIFFVISGFVIALKKRRFDASRTDWTGSGWRHLGFNGLIKLCPQDRILPEKTELRHRC